MDKADKWQVSDGYGTFVDNKDGNWVLADDYKLVYTRYKELEALLNFYRESYKEDRGIK